MSIRYSVVGRAGQVLVSAGNGAGNVSQVVEELLARVAYDTDDRKSYTAEGLSFHYIVSSKIVFLCVADDSFPVTQAFHFLQTLQNEWTRYYGSRSLSVTPDLANADFGRKLSTLLSNTGAPTSSTFGRSAAVTSDYRVEMVNRQIEDVKQQMVSNLDSVLARGERIEALVESTSNLNTNAATFRKTAVSLKRHMWWKNAKCWIILVIVLAIIAFLIALIVCKGNFKTCGKKSTPGKTPSPSPSPAPQAAPQSAPPPPITAPTSPPIQPPPPPTQSPSPTQSPQSPESPPESPQAPSESAPAEVPTTVPTPSSVPLYAPVEAPTDVPTPIAEPLEPAVPSAQQPHESQPSVEEPLEPQTPAEPPQAPVESPQPVEQPAENAPTEPPTNSPIVEPPISIPLDPQVPEVAPSPPMVEPEAPELTLPFFMGPLFAPTKQSSPASINSGSTHARTV